MGNIKLFFQLGTPIFIGSAIALSTLMYLIGTPLFFVAAAAFIIFIIALVFMI